MSSDGTTNSWQFSCCCCHSAWTFSKSVPGSYAEILKQCGFTLNRYPDQWMCAYCKQDRVVDDFLDMLRCEEDNGPELQLLWHGMEPRRFLRPHEKVKARRLVDAAEREAGDGD